jgi:hypothetical protein
MFLSACCLAGQSAIRARSLRNGHHISIRCLSSIAPGEELERCNTLWRGVPGTIPERKTQALDGGFQALQPEGNTLVNR